MFNTRSIVVENQLLNDDSIKIDSIYAESNNIDEANDKNNDNAKNCNSSKRDIGNGNSDNSLYCFEIIIESIDAIGGADKIQIRQFHFKLDQYEWQTIEQDEWCNVGRRCYLVNECGYLKSIRNKKLRFCATAQDGTLHRCDIAFESFYHQKGIAYCKGTVELYETVHGTRTVRITTTMRIFNVDTISPIPTPQSTIAKNQHVQTDDPSKHNKYIQTTATNTPTRNAHIQTSSTKQRTVMTQLSKRKVITRDVAMQFDRMLYYKDIERIINHVIMRIFSSKRFAAALNGKAQKSNNQAPPLVANRLNRMGTRNRYCTLVNNRNNQDSLNKLSNYNRGFNVISRQQLLRTLDRIIDQKQQIILNERTCASKSLPLSRIRTNLRHSENALESKRKDQCKNEKPIKDKDSDKRDKRISTKQDDNHKSKSTASHRSTKKSDRLNSVSPPPSATSSSATNSDYSQSRSRSSSTGSSSSNHERSNNETDASKSHDSNEVFEASTTSESTTNSPITAHNNTNTLNNNNNNNRLKRQ